MKRHNPTWTEKSKGRCYQISSVNKTIRDENPKLWGWLPNPAQCSGMCRAVCSEPRGGGGGHRFQGDARTGDSRPLFHKGWTERIYRNPHEVGPQTHSSAFVPCVIYFYLYPGRFKAYRKIMKFKLPICQDTLLKPKESPKVSTPSAPHPPLCNHNHESQTQTPSLGYVPCYVQGKASRAATNI